MPDGPASPRFAHALTALGDPADAVAQLAAQVRRDLPDPPDLLIMNTSGDHAVVTADLAAMLRHETGARHLIACSAAGVLSGAVELENRTAISVLAGDLPGSHLTPLTNTDLEAVVDQASPAPLAERLPRDQAHACTILFADPFSTPIASLTARLGEHHGAPGEAPVLFGGIASAADTPGGNTLVLDDDARYDGAVAIAISGNLRCDIAVSQGCRPIGPNLTVTRAKGNLLLRLDDRPALEVLRRIVHEISEKERKLLGGGLFLGRSIHENKTHLGRGDYLIRNVVGADEDSGGVAVADIIPDGATVRLHFRDATTATEDLELLLDAQQLHGPPAGAFLVTCNGRGERFFGKQNHDTVTVQRAFLPAESGSEAAKAGEPISPPRAPIPLAGFFAAGEIGPIGGKTFLHGYTACLACFRKREEG
jgi:small ligand-binding sensory domain FIST